MASADPHISNCRHCQHYQTQGRRGGMCQKLNATVQSDWAACSLALPAFASPLDFADMSLPGIIASANAVIHEEAVSIDTVLEPLRVDAAVDRDLVALHLLPDPAAESVSA